MAILAQGSDSLPDGEQGQQIALPMFASAAPQAVADVAEPVEPGASMTYLGGKPWRRYLTWYVIASMVVIGILGAIGSIILPNQVQSIEFARWFTGADSNVNLTQLNNLKTAVAGGATATADQQRLLELFAKFDASRAQSLALITTVGTLITIIVGPLVGVLSDRTRSRRGRRAPWILIGGIGGAAFVIALRFAPSIAFLTLLWTALQAMIYVALGPLNTTVADRVPEKKRGTASGVGGLGNYFGGISGLLFAGAVFAYLGLDTYLILAVILVAGVVAFVTLAKDRSSKDLVVSHFNLGEFLRGFLVPLLDSDFRLVWIARIVLFFGYSISAAFGFFMLQSYITPALSAAEATQTVPLLGLSTLPATLIALALAGRLSDKLGRRKPFVIVAALVIAVSMAVPLLSPTLPGLFIQAVLGGLGLGIYLPVDQALFIDVLPDKNAAGRDLGIAAIGIVVGQALAPIVAGQIVAFSGGYTLVWVAAMLVVLISAVVILPVKRAR